MGLRVATLVNLSFLGGDRADEVAARFIGHRGRTRAIPDGHPPFRHLGAVADSVLHPAWRASGIRPGQGRRRLRAAALRCPTRSGRSASPMARRSLRWPRRARRRCSRNASKSGPAAPWLEGAPLELGRRPDRFAFNNGAVGVEIRRDGRGAAFVLGAERRRRPDRSLPPSARSAAGARAISSTSARTARRHGRSALSRRGALATTGSRSRASIGLRSSMR